MHPLLRRQLAAIFGPEPDVPAQLEPLLAQIEEAYAQADRDRELVERSLDLTTEELLARNAQLQEDVDRRRRAEEARAESDARTQAIIRALPDSLYVVDRHGFTLSAHVCSPLLPSEDECLGQLMYDAIPEPRRKLVAENVAEALASGTVLDDRFERGGRYFDARYSAFEGQYVSIIVRDVTEVQQMQDQLLMAERMASVGTMAAGIAHEINNPLTFVLTNLNHVAEELARLDERFDLSSESDAVVALSEAWDGASRVRRIVSDLRTFSRAETDSRESTCDLHAAIDSAVSIAMTEIRPRARLIKRYGAVGPVRAGSSRVGQVLLNLLINAAQALPIGQAAENRIEISTGERHGEAWVEVYDSGPGISPEIRDRIFDAFFTTKPVGEGSGLGLAICRNIVNGFGGNIGLVDDDRPGTTFRLTLLRAEELTVTPSRPIRNAGPVDQPGTVLIIDDEAELAKSIKRILRDHRVTTARGGKEGLEAILAHEPPYDVVLCDLLMPDLTGMELFEQLSSARPDLAERVVFMTGGALTPVAREFLASREEEHLEKPFDVGELRELVNRRVQELRSP